MIELSIFVTSDTHGYIMPTDYTVSSLASPEALEQPFGVARLATCLRTLQKERAYTLLIDNGDTLQGSPLAQYLALRCENPTPVPLVEVYNRIGIDGAVLGNHEFNFGPTYLKRAMEAANFPVFAANVETDEGKLFTEEAYHIFEKGGVRIAVLGLVTQAVPRWEKPEHIQSLRFLDPVETAKKYLSEMKEKADVIVLSYHGGFARNLETGAALGSQNGENIAEKLAALDGIDVLLTGHQHRKLAGFIDGKPFVMPGFRAEMLGEVKLILEKEKEGFCIVKAEPLLHETKEFAPAEDILACIQKTHDATEAWLDQPLGKVEGDMRITDPLASRLSQHPYIGFINQVQRLATGADISATSIFTATAPGLFGDVSVRQIIHNYMYNNTLAVLRVTGRDVRLALERCAAFFSLDNDHQPIISPFFAKPFVQYYNYDIYDGIDYTFDLRKPIGSRVVQLQYENQKVQEEDTFTLVLNNYRAVGGGHFPMYQAEKIIRDLQVDMTELIIMYFKAHPTVQAVKKENFKVVY